MSSSIEILNGIRKSKSCQPELVIKHGPSLLSSSSISNNELYNIHEQIVIASLDLGLSNIGDRSLKVLKKKFPKSCRVSTLAGMEHESKGNYDAALEIYQSLLAEYPGNIAVMKRNVSVYKATGDYKNAIEEIHKILKYYPGDASTWQELSDIHLSLSDYTAAAYCHEELILIEANCSYYHTHLADIYYTIGGVDSVFKARKHYSMSLALQNAKSNLRALYGLISASKYLAEEYSQGKGNTTDVDVNAALLKFALEQLSSIKFNSSNSEQIKKIITEI